MAQALTFQKPSDLPADALRLRNTAQPTYGPQQVLVKMLAAPINPLDLAVLQGAYPVKPQTFINDEKLCGYDGAGKILECGEEVKDLTIGDMVIIKRHGLGTWTTHAVLAASDVLKVASKLDPCVASILRMGVTPAYLLLEDAEKVKAGDWIIVNAGTGVIAQMICQFAHRRGLKTISVVRDRGDSNELIKVKADLMEQGSAMVIEEKQLVDDDLFKAKRITLALDAVFGHVAEKMAERLAMGATFVTYGFLGGPSAKFTLTDQLIFFKNITFRGFRLSEAMARRSASQQQAMLADFCELFERRELKTPLLEPVDWDSRRVDLEGYLKHAVQKAHAKELGQPKQIFVLH